MSNQAGRATPSAGESGINTQASASHRQEGGAQRNKQNYGAGISNNQPRNSGNFDILQRFLNSNPGMEEVFVEYVAKLQSESALRTTRRTSAVNVEDVTIAPSAKGELEALAWPQWDGKPETFHVWLDLTAEKYRLDAPAGFIGSQWRAWYEIHQSLPADKRNLVHWFWKSGGPGAAYKVQDFFNFLARTFGTRG